MVVRQNSVHVFSRQRVCYTKYRNVSAPRVVTSTRSLKGRVIQNGVCVFFEYFGLRLVPVCYSNVEAVSVCARLLSLTAQTVSVSEHIMLIVFETANRVCFRAHPLRAQIQKHTRG